jgi:regulator of protease activity HflC (stomatin/prohibitin superfamily)
MADSPSSGSAFDLDALKKAVFGNQAPEKGKLPPGTAPASRLGWLWVIPLLWIAITFLRSFVLVNAGERAVVFNRISGTQQGQMGEGLHFVIPFVQQPTIYDIKTQTYTMSGSKSEANTQAGNSNDALSALSADGLPVTLEMSVRFHIDPNRVWKLHQDVGPMFIEKIIRPQTRSHVRMVIAQYPVVDVYGAARPKIITQINERLRRLFAENDIVLDEALLRDVSFSTEFQQAIEQKQVAQQDVQRMEFVVQQADKERRRKIIEAEGEAESIRLKAVALAKNPQLVQYEYVKSLPANVRTVVTDGRTIVNLGDAMAGGNTAAVTDSAPPQISPDAAGGRP